MQFLINEKILSIPPYISTTWDSIVSLHMQQDLLIISLKNGTPIQIPNLSQDILTKIFQTHTDFVQSESKTQAPGDTPSGTNPLFNMDNMINFGFPMRFGGTLEGLGAAMQHNPEQASAPDLPHEVLDKISAVAKIMDTDASLNQSLKAEPHCNCTHCQIARAITGEAPPEKENEEEEVTDEDLKFRTWDIEQAGDKLYTVSNPLDKEEQYSVYLGEPLGCTCGQKNCEHIKAVLNT